MFIITMIMMTYYKYDKKAFGETLGPFLVGVLLLTTLGATYGSPTPLSIVNMIHCLFVDIITRYTRLFFYIIHEGASPRMTATIYLTGGGDVITYHSSALGERTEQRENKPATIQEQTQLVAKNARFTAIVLEQTGNKRGLAGNKQRTTQEHPT